jgi:hypothetical protein
MSKRYQAAILSVTYNGLLVPNAPTIGTATAGAGSASVTFTAPSNVGGGAITSYTVISSPGGIVGTGATSPVTVSGLTNGTAYTFTVVATNAYGSGPASAASNSVTPEVNYIESVFSTWLYTGAGGASLNIPNGIDLAGKGGLVWIKSRSTADYGHVLHDTVRGLVFRLMTNNTNAQASEPGDLASFNSNGFTTGGGAITNDPAQTYASWTFREQPKFFDVVTWSGNGAASREIPHALGSTPGCVIAKRTNNTSSWSVYHRGVTGTLYLNLTNAAGTVTDITAVSATTFTVDSSRNASGSDYVAYVFAHNAGGFGLTGTDNVISCGSYTGNGSSTGPVVTLGYEPQWLLIKNSSSAQDWLVYDNMRGAGSNNTVKLQPNTSNAEDTMGEPIGFTATGFQPLGADSEINANGESIIYIAIRRGPMAVPTTGTSVFTPNAVTGGYGDAVTTGFPIDAQFMTYRPGGGSTLGTWLIDRLRGASTTSTPSGAKLMTSNTNAEATSQGTRAWGNTGFQIANDWDSAPMAYWNFRRAPSFFDEVCYTGNSTARTLAHNLAAVPELMIVKRRNGSTNWIVYSAALGNEYGLILNEPEPLIGPVSIFWNSTTPTSSVFSLGTSTNVNSSANTFVAYLFATCPGVSKVGSYTGTGSTQVINCGFTAGSRFVLIKSTSDSGAWYVWDSARGIVAGNDPYLVLNTTAAEVTNTDWVDTAATGFELSNAGGNLANSNGVSYIFLAIA